VRGHLRGGKGIVEEGKSRSVCERGTSEWNAKKKLTGKNNPVHRAYRIKKNAAYKKERDKGNTTLSMGQ